MATLIGLVSDTHGLLRQQALEALAGVELILHAGDVGKPSVLEALSAVAPVVAIRGNVDRGEWAQSLPPTREVQVEQARFYLIHSASDLDIDPAAQGYTAVVSGHSHRASEHSKDGVLYLNPGSIGPRRFRLPITLMRVVVKGMEIRAQVVELGQVSG